MKHKTLFNFFALIIASTSICQATVSTGTCGDNLTWSFDDQNGTLEIIGYGDMDANTSIWTEIGAGVKKVVIPEGLTRINRSTFSPCTGIKEIIWCARRVNKDYQTMGTYTPFSASKDSVSIIRIQGHIEYLPDYFLASLQNVDTLEVLGVIDTIGNQFTSGCNKLNVFNVKSDIADWCKVNFRDAHISRLTDNILFKGKKLVILNIPDSVEHIGDWAFASLRGLTKVHFGAKVKSTGSYCFRGCIDLMNVTFSDSLRIIGRGTFSVCSALSDITIPESVEYIGYSAFSECNFTSVTIPESVLEVGDYVFYRCKKLSSLHLPSQIKYIGERLVYECSELSIINIPPEVTYIGKSAFEYCDKLSSVTLPNKIHKIGSMAFHGTKVKSIIIPEAVDTIEQNAFYNCYLNEIYWNAIDCRVFGSAFSGWNATAQLVKFVLGIK